jgi:hypothetical protein
VRPLAASHRQLATVQDLSHDLVQAVGPALAGAPLVALAARSEHPVEGRLQPGPTLGVHVALDVEPAIEGLPHVQASPLFTALLLGLHLPGGELMDQAQAPAEEILGIALPGLLQQQALGVARIPAATRDHLDRAGHASPTPRP